jgi:hypothetical protein
MSARGGSEDSRYADECSDVSLQYGHGLVNVVYRVDRGPVEVVALTMVSGVTIRLIATAVLR